MCASRHLLLGSRVQNPLLELLLNLQEDVVVDLVVVTVTGGTVDQVEESNRTEGLAAQPGSCVEKSLGIKERCES